MSKETTTINSVLSMLNEEEFTSKADLVEACKELGYKNVTVNYSISQLKQSNCIEEKIIDGEKMFKATGNKYRGKVTPKKINQTQRYQARKVNYKREIPELTQEQEDFKELVNNHRDDLFNEKIIWEDGNGMKFPLTIAGMGDVTLRCRFFLSNFLDSEPQTGALVYIPWHDERIKQLYSQIEEILTPEVELEECVNFQVAPAK